MKSIPMLLLLAAFATLWSGCVASPTPILRTEYGVAVPLLGAPTETTHTVALAAGMLGTGAGWNNGVEVGTRFHPAGGIGGGTFPEFNLLTTYATEDARIFLLHIVGAGLFGTTSMKSSGYHDTGSTLDLLTPHSEFSVGVPLGAGLALSMGVSLQLLWHVWDDRDFGTQLMLNGTIGVGFFDPSTAPDDHPLCPTFCN